MTTVQITAPVQPAAVSTGIDRVHRKVIFAASLGAIFEWYDFYLYGSMAAVIGKQFFAGVNDTTAFIFALLAFSAGFATRPLGALVFGRLGDLVGRKYTFLITILIMGAATALVGLLPSYAAIGIAAPIILITLRLLQGLAIGGEYGGAATYVAEHAPPGRRGHYTSWIQTTASGGLILSLLVILACRLLTGEHFETWGWRVPYLVSIILLAVSVYIRLQLEESPVFREIQSTGRLSKAPLREAFGQWKNLRLVVLSLFGATAGQSVVSYCSLIYMLLFLEQTLKVNSVAANLLVAVALSFATPFMVVFGKFSDRIGRKPPIMLGFILAGLTLFPIFHGLTHYANPAIETAQRTSPIVVVADPQECSFQFDPIGKARFASSCDIVKTALAKSSVPYSNKAAPAGSIAIVSIGAIELRSFDGRSMPAPQFQARSGEFAAQLRAQLKEAGYPTRADPQRINYPMVAVLLIVVAMYGPLVYASLAAWLAELFPPRIRYTSMSLPYHIGNGWIGGFLPTVSFALIAYTGNIYQGLWYPTLIALMSFVVGGLFLRETKDQPMTE